MKSKRVDFSACRVAGTRIIRRLLDPRIRLLPFVFCLLSFRPAHASQAQLKQGNRQFWNGHYDRALKYYNDALVDMPHSSVLHFNAGDAAYQTGDFEKAEKEFAQAAESGVRPLQAAAHYNRGNALFRQNKWEEAIEAYKESLRINPQDEDAKYNLSVALKMKNNPPLSQPKSGGDQKKKDEKAKNGKSKKEPLEGQQQKEAKMELKPGQMSKEDAERLLSAVGTGEPKKSMQKFPKTELPHPDEDW